MSTQDKTPKNETVEEPKSTPGTEPGTQPKSDGETFEFQSEVKQLLNILVYSLYKHKEVFLRELVSNAVDALNKVQFEALTNSDIEDRDLDLKIDISFDKDKNKLIIEDTGIGMTRQELIDNLGTIAHSGTLDFVKRITEAESNDKMDLIGQFGVGFYASFMVAHEIHVHTRSYLKGSKGLIWKSTGGTSYTIDEKGKQHRGTRIELFLKEDQKEFTGKPRLKSIITQHSRFVPFPIFLESEKIDMVEAIWTQPKSTLKDEDYNEFYRFFQNTDKEPETHLHLSADAPVQFNSVLYIPPHNTEVYGWVKMDPGMDLYSRKILIQKSCPEILPVYLRFIKGIVDTEDIPLNISRESIQSNNQINSIRKFLMKKILAHFNKIKTENREKYLKIWNNFSKNFKEGIPNEYEYREQLAELLLFKSSKTGPDEYTDLQTYADDMTQDQIEIYYATGPNYQANDSNPAIEVFKKKDLEVLYMDPMDAWAIGHMPQYKGKILRPVEKANIKLDHLEDEAAQEALKDARNFAGYLKTIFAERLHDVQVSRRLVDSPCMLVDGPKAASIPMDQSMRNKRKRADFSSKIMEINKDNKLIAQMIHHHKDQPDSPKLKTLALQLLDNLILLEGITEDIEKIVPRVHDIMYEAIKKD